MDIWSDLMDKLLGLQKVKHPIGLELYATQVVKLNVWHAPTTSNIG